jgi:hypothetical protein
VDHGIAGFFVPVRFEVLASDEVISEWFDPFRLDASGSTGEAATGFN